MTEKPNDIKHVVWLDKPTSDRVKSLKKHGINMSQFIRLAILELLPKYEQINTERYTHR